jgi:DNA-binding PadR family transcriptional regulator
MEKYRFPKIFYTYSAKGKEERGRPIKRWRNPFQKIAVGKDFQYDP